MVAPAKIAGNVLGTHPERTIDSEISVLNAFRLDDLFQFGRSRPKQPRSSGHRIVERAFVHDLGLGSH